MDNNGHLKDEELVTAVVDEKDLTDQARAHLNACIQCRQRLLHLEEQLGRIGQYAHRHSPVPSCRSIDYAGTRTVFWGRYSYALGTAVMSAILIIAVSWGLSVHQVSEQSVSSLIQEMIEDERFIAEISRLEEDPLLQGYQEDNVKVDGMMDEDFIRFIIPIDAEQTGADVLRKRGVKKC